MLKDKKIIVFDLDGTLARSKLPIDAGMAKLLARLTQEKKVAVISGGKFALFKSQVLAPVRKYRPNLENLYLFPTSGATLYRYKSGWYKVYELKIMKGSISNIKTALKSALLKARFVYPRYPFGSLIENRGTQITFSALGQRAPLPLKRKWNWESDTRPKIMKILKKLLPGFEIREGGLTSIDITRKGVDKGYAIRKLIRILKTSKKNVLFVGDAIFPGGNDYAAKKIGVECVKVSGPAATKRILKRLIDTWTERY